MSDGKYIETVTLDYLASKIGLYYIAESYFYMKGEKIPQPICKEVEYIENQDIKFRSVIYERIGRSDYNESETLKPSVSKFHNIKYNHSSHGFSLVKSRCIREYFYHLGDILIRINDKIEYIKKKFPYKITVKENNNTKELNRLRKMADDIFSILWTKEYSNTRLSNEYHIPLVEVDRDKEIQVFRMLPEEHDFYYVNIPDNYISKVKAVPFDYSEPSVNKSIDADISYKFVDEEGKVIPYSMTANTDLYLKDRHLLKANNGKVAIFWKKDDAIEFVEKWRDYRLSKLNIMINKYSDNKQ